jgi:hypothetical protein
MLRAVLARVAVAMLVPLLAVTGWATPAFAQQQNAYVVDLVLVSSVKFSRDETDFTYRIKVTNLGRTLTSATAFVTSTGAATKILDNTVVLGTVPTGATITSTDTFVLRQNRTVAFKPSDLVWTIQGVTANTPPAANAGPDQSVKTGTKVTLDATASIDADGDPLTYRWTFVSKPAGSAAVLSSTTAGRPTFTVDRGGTYVFRLVVNDGRTDSTFDEVRISTVNAAPIANAGPDRTVARGATVTLDGTASSDPDFDALGFTWSVFARPSGSVAALLGDSTMNPTITLDKPGTYTFRLVVSDGQLSSTPDDVTIDTTNSAPVADAGPDQTGEVGTVVVLDGRGSRDADGDSLTFTWTWQSRPTGSAAVLQQGDFPQPFFTPDVAGLYTAQLIVNDGLRNSAPDTVTVTVAARPNRAPNAVADVATTPAGVPVTIAVLGNDSDPDGQVVTLQSFTQPSAGGTVTRAGNSLTFTPAAGFAGIASFAYTISDGSLTASTTVTVTVIGASNAPPVVNAGPDLSVRAPYPNATVTTTLAGSASDDGRPTPPVLTVAWSVVSGPGAVTFVSPAAATTDATFGAPGTYVLRLTASDGALTTSDDAIVVVAPALNTAPSLVAIPDRTANVGDVIALQLAASDSDPSDTLTYTLGAAPAGATLTPAGRFTWTPTVVQTGTRSITVTVRDAGGLSDTKSFRVTVVAVNRAPEFGALTDDATRVGANYAKTLTATDPEGGPVTFTLLGGPDGMTLTGAVLTWKPGAAQTGPSTVRVQVADAQGLTDASAFLVTVATATPPVAVDDVYAVQVGQSITIEAPGVLANDRSLGGGPLSSRRTSDPAFGTVGAFGANGGFTYTAPAADPRPPFAITGRILTSDPNVGEDLLGWAPLGDLNGDGKPDLITNRFNGFRAIATSGGTGARLWGTNPPCSLQPNDSPMLLLADIDDDGHLEYVHSARCDGEGGNLFSTYTRLQALTDTGGVKWTSAPVTAPVTFERCASVSNCSGVQSRLEWTGATQDVILSAARLAPNDAPVLLYRQYVPTSAALSYGSYQGAPVDYINFGCEAMTGDPADHNTACMVTVLVSATDGRVLQVLKAPLKRGAETQDNNPYRNNSVIAVDLDGDGVPELVAGADVWKRNGSGWTLAWQAPIEPEQVVVVDLDGDGRPEIVHHVVASETFDASVPVQERGAETGLRVYDANGTLLRRIPMTTSRSGLLSATDVDGDGRPELLITQGGIAYAFNSDGTEKWTFAVADHPLAPQPAFYRTTDNTNMVAYDLDGDGNREVVLSSLGYVYVLDGRTGAEKARFDTGPRPRGDASGMVYVTDWDGDGHADILVVNQRGLFGFGSSEAGWVITSARNDWMPAPTFYGQIDFRASSFDANGRVLYDASAPREFRNPQQLGTIRDPRESAGTSFTYVANDGLADSAPAKVFLSIEPGNHPPVITSTPPTAYLGQAFRSYQVVYRIAATDPDAGDTLTYSIDGFTNAYGFPPPIIDAQTGAVSIFATNETIDYTNEIFVTVTDSRGAKTTQSFVINNTWVGIPAPEVAGQPVAAASATLTAARLQYRVAQEQFSATVPAGRVISQNPLAGATVARGGTVDLIVSKGAQPAIVPNVLGLPQTIAATRIAAAGFTVGTVTRVFSDTVPRGEVIAQSPASAGLVVPGPVTLTVSAGNGLVLRLATSLTTADKPITFQVLNVDLNGVETPASGATLAVSSNGTSTGALPTVSGLTLTPAATSRGAFVLTATNAAGRTTRVGFAVGAPDAPGDESVGAAYRRLSAAMSDIDALLVQARAALAANDVARQRSVLTQIVTRWRQLDLVDLEISDPMAPETGFKPLPSQLAGFGVTATPDDLVLQQVLADADADLKDWIDGLRSPGTSIAELSRRADRFATRAARLNGLVVTEWGTVTAAGKYQLLAGKRIPQLYEAIVDELAVVVGLPATRVAAADLANRSEARYADAGGRSGAGDAYVPGDAVVASTLAELAVTQATQWVVDKVIEDFNAKYKNAKQFGEDILKQAFFGAATVAVAQHLRSFIAAEDIGDVVSGASLSIRLFDSSYSFLEGRFETDDPDLNYVFVIGPSIYDLLKPLIDNSKKTFTAAKDAKKNLKGLLDSIRTLIQSANTDVNAAATQARQFPTGVDRPCIFTPDPDCTQLLFDDGFQTVYEYTPPPGFEAFSGLPQPIVFLVWNARRDTYFLATPPFLPTKKQAAP